MRCSVCMGTGGRMLWEGTPPLRNAPDHSPAAWKGAAHREIILHALRFKRTALAEKWKRKEQQILPDSVLGILADAMPRSVAELLLLDAMTPFRALLFGKEFLPVLRAYRYFFYGY